MVLFAVFNQNGVLVNHEKPQVIDFSRSVDGDGKISLLFSLTNGVREEVTDIIGEYRDTCCQVYKTDLKSYVFVSQ